MKRLHYIYILIVKSYKAFMKRVYPVFILFATIFLLSACNSVRNDILSCLHQLAEEVVTTEKENWEEDINYRYKWAILETDMEILKDCIAEGADPKDVNGTNPAYLAYTQKNYIMAEYLLGLGASPNWSDKKGNSTLHLLTRSNTFDECKILLDYGADVNYVDKEGMTEIEFAATNQMAGIDILQLLIDFGAKVTPKTVKNAFESGNRDCDIIRFLVNELRKSNAKTDLDPIIEYAIMGETQKVKELVKKEYKKLSMGEVENILKFTGAYGSVETLKEIEKQKKYVEQKDWIISEAALKNGNIDILEYCLNNKMLDIKNSDRYPLTVAIEANQYNVVKFLIEQGADVNKEEYPDLAINARETAINGNVEMLKLLLMSGYNIEEEDTIGVVLEAAKYNKTEILQYLSEKGFLKKVINCDESPLDNAGVYSFEVVKYLINQGFSVNGFSNSGFPLYTSIDNNNTEMSIFLIEQGADVNIFCNELYLMKAIKYGNLEIVKALVEHGADINANDYGRYPLVSTAMGSTILRYLVEQGADVNVQNEKTGITALMTAADYGNVKGINILLEAGADKAIKNKEGQTAYDIAKENDHKKCMELLADKH